MKWRYRFQVLAPAAAVEEAGYAPDQWMTYFKAYRGLESVDANWPEEGSSIVTRYAALGPWQVKLTHTIVELRRGRGVRFREEALSGLWIDNVEWALHEAGGATDVTVTASPTSKALLLRLLFQLTWPVYWLIGRPAMRRMKAMIESSRRPSQAAPA